MTSKSHKDKSKNLEIQKNLNIIKSDLNGDWSNFFLLMLLYTMQGLPLGLASAMPIILQTRKNVTYQDQVIISILNKLFSKNMNYYEIQTRIIFFVSEHIYLFISGFI